MKNSNQKYVGMFCKLITSPAMYLMAKNAEMDFIFYDCEHGMLNNETLHDLILFGNNIDLPTFVRVAELSRKEVSQVLDCGARAVMVPMIETKEQAEKLVEWSKYTPIGNRGYSSGANTNYGPSGGHQENMENLNNQTVTIVQIETKLGIENIEDIAAVSGVDAIIVGPVDLSISLGNTGNIMHKNELSAIDKVIKECKRNNLMFGIIGSEKILNHFKEDVNYWISANDSNLIRDGIQNAVETFKSYTGEDNER